MRRISNSWSLYVTSTPILILLSIVGMLQGTPDSSAQERHSGYLHPAEFASPIRRFMIAFGDRLERPGKERVTLVGRYTDGTSAADVRFVWELPGRFRLDRSDRPNQPAIYDNTTGWNSPGITQTEAGGLESLVDDTPESFFYDMLAGVGHRFLGNGFRDVGSRNSDDASYDVYQVFASVRSPVGVSRRGKAFFFDSHSGLLSRVEYLTAGSVRVVTEIGGWQIVNGQALPGTVTRKENDSIVLRVVFTSTSVEALGVDSVLSTR